MLKRTITGAVILIITALFVFLKQYHVLFFDLFVAIISLASIIEISHALSVSGVNHNRYILYVEPVLMCLNFNLAKTQFQAFCFTILGTLVLIMYLLAEEIVLYSKRRVYAGDKVPINQSKTLFDRTKNTLQILIYPLILLSFLFALNHLETNISFVGIILSFAVAMLTDTFAFLVGVALGKKKLIPEVSPYKSVAGMIGGFVGGIIGALSCFFIFYYCNLFNLPNIVGLTKGAIIFSVIGVFGSFLTQLGDLIESAFKRRLKIKDFSDVFPGHGGFMDRVDGLMFSSTFIYIMFVLFIV